MSCMPCSGSLKVEPRVGLPNSQQVYYMHKFSPSPATSTGTRKGFGEQIHRDWLAVTMKTWWNVSYKDRHLHVFALV